jgi:hypothetical protein
MEGREDGSFLREANFPAERNQQRKPRSQSERFFVVPDSEQGDTFLIVEKNHNKTQQQVTSNTANTASSLSPSTITMRTDSSQVDRLREQIVLLLWCASLLLILYSVYEMPALDGVTPPGGEEGLEVVEEAHLRGRSHQVLAAAATPWRPFSLEEESQAISKLAAFVTWNVHEPN